MIEVVKLNSLKEKYYFILIKKKQSEKRKLGKEQLYRLKRKEKYTPQSFSKFLIRKYIHKEKEIHKKLQIYVSYNNKKNVYFNAFIKKKAITNVNLGKKKFKNKSQKLTLANYKETLNKFLERLQKRIKIYLKKEKKRLKTKVEKKFRKYEKRWRRKELTEKQYKRVLSFKKEELKMISKRKVRGIIRMRGKPYKQQLRLLIRGLKLNKKIKLEWIENYNPMVYRAGIRERHIRRV